MSDEITSELCFVDSNVWLYSLSHWDSLKVATALQSDPTLLYSEDMQDGLVVDKQLTITNPFTPG